MHFLKIFLYWKDLLRFFPNPHRLSSEISKKPLLDFSNSISFTSNKSINLEIDNMLHQRKKHILSFSILILALLDRLFLSQDIFPFHIKTHLKGSTYFSRLLMHALLYPSFHLKKPNQSWSFQKKEFLIHLSIYLKTH